MFDSTSTWLRSGQHAIVGLLVLGSMGAVGCDRSRSNGGPKVKAAPDPVAQAPSAGAPDTGGGQGVSTYPAKPTAPPPVPPPEGKGLDIRLNRYIVVDQFGYRPDMAKVAILVDPVHGWNGDESYTPGDKLEVRKWSDGSFVHGGAPTPWNNGKVDEASGDRGSWFDFSSVKEPGLYYVYDPKDMSRSHPFEIAHDVYAKPLMAATRMYYFNRANFEKKPPYSCVGRQCWSLGADHVGPLQDKAARSVTDRENPKTSRDLSGGWWDAGDTNKYVTYAHDTVNQLLTAFTEAPRAFSDATNIPESGNGTPDLLDEIKYELEWLKRMQPKDLGGGVLLKVGHVDYGDPVPDESQFRRFYYPKPCSSSTIAAASMFAHAAVVYGEFEAHKAFADDLKQRAISAFEHYHQNPKSDQCDDTTIKSGDADQPLPEQDQEAVVAAVYLFAATGEAKYGDYVKQNFRRLRPYHDDRWSVYNAAQGDALFYYAALKQADPALKKEIHDKKKAEANSREFYKFVPERDFYRAYMRRDSYHWGSNRERAAFGNTNFDLVQYGLAKPDEVQTYRERAAGMLHSFHGVNPMQLVYLTNMYAYGAEESADELFHTWFRDHHPTWDNARTSKLGPAPGYVTGGPNAQYCGGAGPEHACSRSPVKSQPPGKAYLDSNTGWEPENPFDKSWELTEPGIYYQAAYIRLVSKFVD